MSTPSSSAPSWHTLSLPDLVSHLRASLRQRPGTCAREWLLDPSPPRPRARLEDAVALLLKGFVAPAEEEDPLLLGDLLTLVEGLQVQSAREALGALVLGGRSFAAEDPTLPSRLRLVLLGLRRDAESSPGFWQELGGGSSFSDSPRLDFSEGGLLPGDAAPQVNDPSRVFQLVSDVVSGKVSDRSSYTGTSGLSGRHADFAARAASSLGLLQILPGGIFRATPLARELPQATDPTGAPARRAALARHPLVEVLLASGLSGPPLRAASLSLVESRTPLTGTTAERRALCLLRWVEWWKEGGR